ncbi:hypothetical protein NONI108955_21930 [Nocardia ninae]|uniref:Uncharacterized protein n=1 Tax=Nocardia ninae NBRC 108245 TaxID=1210091 RepID=A0A511MS85_9NOCA|nr:hypothetical protein [Nocardia ninae]GEM43453.1 hypothetical protein NN4_79720 [Nocardia ninae NBRC 108245]
MANRKRTVTASEVQDVLNYFGKCPICDYPARAWHLTAQFDDGRIESQTVAACGGWCGWKGPVSPTPMTGDTAVLTQGQRNCIDPRRPSPARLRAEATEKQLGELPQISETTIPPTVS